MKIPDQPDLFGAVSRQLLREEERFGKLDARSGLGLWNLYSRKLSGDRRVAYERGFREECARAAP